LALKTTWNDYTTTFTFIVDFPACSEESNLLVPMLGLPTPGQTLPISKFITIIGENKLSKDADGLSYSDLCGDSSMSFKPSVTGDLY